MLFFWGPQPQVKTLPEAQLTQGIESVTWLFDWIEFVLIWAAVRLVVPLLILVFVQIAKLIKMLWVCYVAAGNELIHQKHTPVWTFLNHLGSTVTSTPTPGNLKLGLADKGSIHKCSLSVISGVLSCILSCFLSGIFSLVSLVFSLVFSLAFYLWCSLCRSLCRVFQKDLKLVFSLVLSLVFWVVSSSGLSECVIWVRFFPYNLRRAFLPIFNVTFSSKPEWSLTTCLKDPQKVPGVTGKPTLR